MKKRILLFTIIIGIGALALSSYITGPAHNGYDCTGAEAGGVGPYANPVGCSVSGGCHGPIATTTVGVAIELDSLGVPTTHYTTGTTYTIKITGTNGTGLTLPYYGFQLAAMKGTTIATVVQGSGTWATTGLPARTRISPAGANTYLSVAEHGDTIAIAGTTFTQSFSWTPLSTDTGAVSIWGAVNFVNGNGLRDTGDKWNTHHIIINKWVHPVSVPAIADNMDVNVFPNPVTSIMNVQLNNAQSGAYIINVYDLNSRLIASDNIDIASAFCRINTGSWASGIYNVVIYNGSDRKVMPIIKR